MTAEPAMTLRRRLELVGHLARSVLGKFSDGFYFQTRVAFSAVVIGGCGYVGHVAGASWIGAVIDVLVVMATLLAVELHTEHRNLSLAPRQPSPTSTASESRGAENATSLQRRRCA